MHPTPASHNPLPSLFHGAGRAWWTFVASGFVLLLAWALVPSMRQAVSASAVIIPAAAVCLAIVWRRPTQSRLWMLFAVGSILIAIGASLMSLMDHRTDHNNLFGAITASGQGVQVGALALLVRARGAVDRMIIVDLAVLLLAVVLVVWFGLVSPALATGGHVGNEVILVNTAMTVLFLGIAIRLLVAPGRRELSFWLLVATIVAVLVSLFMLTYALVHGTYRPGSVTDIGFIIAGALWPLAVLHPSIASLADRSTTQATGHVGSRGVIAMSVATVLAEPLILLLSTRQLDGADIVLLVLAQPSCSA